MVAHSGHFLQALFGQSPDLWYVLDPKTKRLIFASENFLPQLGYPPSDLLAYAWDHWVHPDDHKAALTFYAGKFWQQELPRFPLRLRHRDGRYLWYEESLTFIPANEGEGPFLLGQLRQVDEQAALREQLNQAQANLEAFFQNPQQLILFIGTDLRLLFINQVAQKYYKELLHRDVKVGDRMLELVHPAHKESFQANFNRALQGESLEVERELPLPHGTFHFNFHYRPVVEAGGKINRVVFSVQDITEKRRAEKALIESEARIRMLIEGSNVQFWYQDLDLKYVWIYNPHRTVKPEMVIGKGDHDFFPSEQADHLTRLKQAVIESGVAARHEVKVTVEGEDYHHELFIEPRFDGDHRVVGIACLDIDITRRAQAEAALRASESQYRKLIDLMDEGVVLFGPGGEVKTFNLAAQAIYEFTPAQFEAPDPHHYRYIREDGSPVPLSEHPGWIALQEGRALQGVIMGLQLDDKLKWVKKSAIPISLPEDPRPHALVTIDDITDLKEKEAKLHEANATKDRFFSLISHDLRSPLNAIFGLTEILEEEVQGRGEMELARMIGMLKEASAQAIDLLVNLLEWSRSQSGRIAFDPAPLQLLPLVQETQKLLAGNLEEKQLAFSSEVPEPLWIEADKNMLRTILRNLLSNAVKFTPTGGKVRLKAWKSDGYVFCSVTDSGVGIKKKDLGKLFRLDQPFSSPGTRQEKGTGLGLILCKDFIERHGGSLTVDSTFGQGSTFTFSLPAAPF